MCAIILSFILTEETKQKTSSHPHKTDTVTGTAVAPARCCSLVAAGSFKIQTESVVSYDVASRRVGGQTTETEMCDRNFYRAHLERRNRRKSLERTVGVGTVKAWWVFHFDAHVTFSSG